MQKDGRTALMAACSNGHMDIVKLLLVVPGLDVNATEVSCVSGKRLHAVISHRHVRWEPEVKQDGWVRGRLEPGCGLRGRRAVAGVAVCRSTRRLL